MKAIVKNPIPLKGFSVGTEIENAELIEGNVTFTDHEGFLVGFAEDRFEIVPEHEKPKPALLEYFKDENRLPFYNQEDAEKEFLKLAEFAAFVRSESLELSNEQIVLRFFDFQEYSTKLAQQ